MNKQCAKKFEFRESPRNFSLPVPHKVLTASFIDGDNKYFTCVYAVFAHRIKVGYTALERGIIEWMSELIQIYDYRPSNVCANCLSYIGSIWQRSTRLICAERVLRLLMKRFRGELRTNSSMWCSTLCAVVMDIFE
jgi:hypothetical protein